MYKVFEIAQMADGQESRTRYIIDGLDRTSRLRRNSDSRRPRLPRWMDVMAKSFAAYQAEYARLDQEALANPSLVRLPRDAKPAVVTRLRKNYALGRARYFIPFATRTNLGLVQTCRAFGRRRWKSISTRSGMPEGSHGRS